MRRLLALPLLAAFTACGGESSSSATAATATPVARAVDPATAATITGTVLVEGPLPADRKVRLDGDPKCVALNGAKDRELGAILAGDNGTLQNVFVYVKDSFTGWQFPAPAEPVLLDQQKCAYVPRVLGVRVDQALAIRNSDPLMHNVRSESDINQRLGFSEPMAGVTMNHRFNTREVMVPFKCDVHAWMRAYVGVLDHPFFAVTAQPGTFSLAGLPPGSYTVEAWHETLGTQTAHVTVGAKETRDLRFTFKAPAS
jgi:hypothetical protein